MIFESHAHYDDEAFDEDRSELLDALPAQGIGRVINVCAEVEGWDRTVDLMERYPYIYGAVGVHPDDVGALDEEKIRRMHQICQMEKTVAVGEIGLDYYWDKENHEKQIYWFERQLEVAREEKLPFIIHSRDAAKDTLDTMKRLHAGHYTAEEMVGKKVMVLVNLKPAKLAGVLSEGMLLCAEDADGNLSLMVPEKKMPAGAEIC